MCGLCGMDFGLAPTDRSLERLKARATEVKNAIKVIEALMAIREDLGEAPCPVSVDTLLALKGEQFELARRI